MKYNQGYPENTFTVSKVSRDYALLPGVGKFCSCGCGGQVKGSIVTRIRLGIKQKYFLPPTVNQIYAKKSCKKRLEYLRAKQRGDYKKKKNIIHATIDLLVTADKIPYRKLTLNHGKGIRTILKITPKDKLLWNYTERLCRYNGNTIQIETLAEVQA